MIIPFAKLIEGLFIIDGVAEHTDASISEEEMRQVMHGGVARRVPNVQLHLVLVDLDQLGVVLDHVRRREHLALLLLALHERADDGGFAHVGVPHEDHLRVLHSPRLELRGGGLQSGRLHTVSVAFAITTCCRYCLILRLKTTSHSLKQFFIN